MPTNTDLSLRRDDTADDDFAAADGVDLRKLARKTRPINPEALAMTVGPVKPALPSHNCCLPHGKRVTAPGGDLKLFARWGEYTKLGEGAVLTPPLAPSERNSSARAARRPFP